MSPLQLAILIASIIQLTLASTNITEPRVVLTGTATYFSWPSGGNSCGTTDSYCVAISDGWDALWTDVLRIPTKCGYIPNCNEGCSTCCQRAGPSCPYSSLCHANGGYICVRCIDGDICKTGNWIKVAIADACPQHHPCNTCKGSENPCAEGLPHIDLCSNAFFAIAKYQPSWEGLSVEVTTSC
eukprot:TRINITY_DN863_c0_g1_i1.p1 TRINITY_DN863_c0_g1~~TRINITY_DN863_c0_g1_i1.p1  ORF type:complete len:213 (-),score=32.36 TRINITY_DN863_c0_g1_i1:60-611(-)